MFPKWHILFGAIFTFIIWLTVPRVPLTFLALVFLSSFLIDFDHYMAFVLKTKNLSLRNAFEYYRKGIIKMKKEVAKGIKRKGDFHIFHTIEFHVLVGLFGFVWIGFFYIFIGMIFHSLLDILSMAQIGALHAREFFFFNWVRKRI